MQASAAAKFFVEHHTARSDALWWRGKQTKQK